MNAIAQAKGLGISTKDAVEIANALRGKTVKRAQAILEEAIAMKVPIPYRRFTNGVGHRRGNLSSGRYPILASKAILKVILSAAANANAKGMDSDLVVEAIIANKGSQSPKYGRKRGHTAKSTHISVTVVEAGKKKAKKASAKKETKKPAEPKKETTKPVEKAEEKTEEKKETEKKPVEKKEVKEEKPESKSQTSKKEEEPKKETEDKQ